MPVVACSGYWSTARATSRYRRSCACGTPPPHYRGAGFLTYGEQQKGHTLSGYKVYYFNTGKDLGYLRARLGIDGVLFAHPADARAERDRLLRYCPASGLQALIAPAIDMIRDGQVPKPIRKIRIEDLLGRPEIKISMDEIERGFRDKTVLVTGAAGSIGSELCRQLAGLGIRELVMLDNARRAVEELERLSREVRIPEMLGLMERLVPEYQPGISCKAKIRDTETDAD